MKKLNHEAHTYPTMREASNVAEWHRRRGHKVDGNRGWGLRRFVCDTCEKDFYWIYQGGFA